MNVRSKGKYWPYMEWETVRDGLLVVIPLSYVYLKFFSHVFPANHIEFWRLFQTTFRIFKIHTKTVQVRFALPP